MHRHVCGIIIALLCSATRASAQTPECVVDGGVQGEFYFSRDRLPTSSDCKDEETDRPPWGCAVVGDYMDIPIRDTGTAFAEGRDQGMAYGWNCNGALTFPEIPAHCVIDRSDDPVSSLQPGTCEGTDAGSCTSNSLVLDPTAGGATCEWVGASTAAGNAVDFSGGQRPPPREIYGLISFDPYGACAGYDTNWEVAVPNGSYDIVVDFAQDTTGRERRLGPPGYSGLAEFDPEYNGLDNCNNDHAGEDAVGYLKVEGAVACYYRPGCVYSSTVLVTDGRITVTGQGPSLTTGSRCHTLGFVKYQASEPACTPMPVSYAYVTPVVTAVSTGVDLGGILYNTYTLAVILGGGAFNLHSVYGDANNSMVLPAAYQLDVAAGGTNFGGIDAALISVLPDLAHDSWITVGETSGADSTLTSTITDAEYATWTASSGFVSTNGMLVYFSGATSGTTPGTAPGSGSIVVGQLTVAQSALPATASMNFQGHTQDRATEIMAGNRTADWVESAVVFNLV